METKTKVPIKKGSATYKIIIPEKVERLIRFLCERVWTTEWSGVLFYNYEGEFEDGSLKIICEDILPMDIGSTTYTEFNMSPDVISYMAEKQELLDCKMGLIHSHNNMSTFFSDTDMNTLQEEGSERNHFVSLIVNNEGKYSAAITRKIKYTAVKTLTYEGFTGVKECGEETIEGEEVEYFVLDVEIEAPQDNSIKEVADRLAEIKKSKEFAPKYGYGGYGSYGGYGGYSGYGSPNYKTPELNKDLVNYKQPTLFDEMPAEDDEVASPTYRGQGFGSSPVVQVAEKKEDKELIHSILCQLITGSISCTHLNKDDFDKAVKTIERRFDGRFGKIEGGELLFEYWATDFIEFLTWYSLDDDKDEMTPDELSAAVARELRRLPVRNKYVDKFIELLVSYEEKTK